MKKFLLIITLVFTFFITNINVNAETLQCNFTNRYEQYFSRFGKDFIVGELDKLYDIYVNEYQDEYPFYQIDAEIVSAGSLAQPYLRFKLIVFTETPKVSWYSFPVSDGDDVYKYFAHYNLNSYSRESIMYTINDDDSLTPTDYQLTLATSDYLILTESLSCTISPPFYSSLKPLFIMPSYLNITQIDLQVEPGSSSYYNFTADSNDYWYEPYSTYLDLNPELRNYVEVNLDNYEYVILNLKSYTDKNAFSSNLKVKGMIGITPVYEFGTIEKNEITDRCNISYSDYTDYRLYVLENDIINNSVYYVKACEDNSSFKFDSSIFDITYVTDDNVDDPVITVGGQEYNTIPFNKLTNSANKNEEENFIPGASEGFTPLKDLASYITSFWSSLTTFMSLVTKFFNTLPIEIRAVCITFFTTACTLGILKILKN